jgi:thiol-disulfide isomerase/thioredoxin
MAKCAAITQLLLTLVVGVLILSFTGEGAAARANPQPQRGERKVLGDLELRSPTGEHVSLIPLITRKALVIVFWAAWCPICREEVPQLNKLDAVSLIKVVAVNEGDSVNKIQSFMATHSVGYQVVVDPDASVAKAFQVPSMPFCVILSMSGLIVYRGSGLPENIDYYVVQ